MNGLVIEGADNVGKTTIAKKLAKYFGWTYRHMSKPAPDAEFPAVYLQYIRGNAVCDRLHVGGFVYGHELGLHPFDPKGASLMWDVLRNAGYRTIIMFHGSDSGMEELLDTLPKEEMFSKDIIIRANAIFRRIARSRPYGSIAWDVGEGYPTPDAIVELLNDIV